MGLQGKRTNSSRCSLGAKWGPGSAVEGAVRLAKASVGGTGSAKEWDPLMPGR